MESFLLAVSVVLPLIVYMAAGGIIRKLDILSEENFKAMNRMIFRIFIPLALFFSIYKANLKAAMQPELFIFAVVSVLIAFGITWRIIMRCVKDIRDAATMIQGIYRSNFVLFGTTIGLAMCGDDGMAAIAALSAIIVPMFNILAVILFESIRGGEMKLKETLINIFKNPLVDAGILGIVVNLSGFRIPELFYEPLSTLGDIATPLALVTLGGMLSLGSMVSHRKCLIAVVLGRLVIIPGFVMALAIALGFRNENLVAVLAIFGSPTAVASAPMAQAMGGNGGLAGEIVAVTSLCCIVTIFLFVFGLSNMGFVV